MTMIRKVNVREQFYYIWLDAGCHMLFTRILIKLARAILSLSSNSSLPPLNPFPMPEPNRNLPPLYAQNPLERFSNRAADYAKYRPTYPAAAIDYLLAGLPQPDQLAVADVGAGTGISARLLADRGAQVWAIEPNAAMREAAEPHPRVEVLAGTAEQTGLPDRSVDLVLCAQSFHWFEPIAALSEFQRILHPAGRVALMWNDRDQTDELTRDYSAIIDRAADRQVFDRSDRKSSDALAESRLFTHYRAHSFAHVQPLSPTQLMGLALSASYIPKQGAAYDRLLIDLQQLCDRWTVRSNDGLVYLAYQTHVYLAELL